MGIKGSGKGAEARGEESIYGSLMAKLWHFQTPSCAAYGNTGCLVFKGEMQIQIDFWQKSIFLKEFFLLFLLIDMVASQ